MNLVTKGLGGGQSVGLVLQGMTFAALRTIRGGRSALKDVYTNLIEEFTIAVKLLEINGKESLLPIFNRRKYTVNESINHKVNIRNIKVEKRKEENKTNVFAKIISINRGSDG